ncbi:MAG TPA: tetratricopeptide repeat protein [bacterium]|nr:tetratricopeptide repeat protein [bacterium]
MKNRLSAAAVLIVAAAMLFAAARAGADEAAGDALMQKKEYKKAAAEYKKVIESKGEKEALVVKLAEAYEAAKWHGMSVQVWERYIELFPNGKVIDRAKKRAAAARRWMGVNFYNLGEDMDKVIHQLKLAVELDPSLLEAYYWLGRVYVEEGMLDEAVSILEKLASMDPKDKKAAWLLKEAKGMKDVGGNAYVAYREGFNLYEKGMLNEALTKYSKAAELNPDFAAAHVWIARILLETEQYSLSEKSWKRVLELEPDNKRAEWFMKLAAGKAKETGR